MVRETPFGPARGRGPCLHPLPVDRGGCRSAASIAPRVWPSGYSDVGGPHLVRPLHGEILHPEVGTRHAADATGTQSLAHGSPTLRAISSLPTGRVAACPGISVSWSPSDQLDLFSCVWIDQGEPACSAALAFPVRRSHPLHEDICSEPSVYESVTSWADWQQ